MWPIEIGTKALDEYIVREQDTAITFDSGGLEVLATPMLICSAERSCKNLVDPLLEPGQGTVGTLVNIRHLAPTPVGMKYRCECEVIAVEGRMIRFHVELHDETELIGEGIHERYVINNSRFMDKVNHKLEQLIETQLTDLIEEQIRTAAGQTGAEPAEPVQFRGFSAELQEETAVCDDSLMERFLALLERGDFRRNREIAYYADKLFVTSKYLSEVCKKVSGFPANYWINRFTVLDISRQLRDKKRSFTELTDLYGFSSPSYFSRYVQKYLGASPTDFRE